ncbi:MAG: tRNA uridine-5-carboxymethylaminomethyl(34) synthesis GTPase MnmE [Syntrophobacterales bacterium CG_4_8_14_3_um_filter_49_14]|nr:MAG: tRNA uridine-5-carboxymethylaminomethyl(34) synthesis GTPase MnmE [Syntrophobacterales bacterium CG23_combo_of_CG06-09_8_20_14_all_48_27]PJC74728.1 MAG: tRNA uridine-5-carboxymethylaminomethyl(34) synthesis GTPase MnmE [Syntrophobacterales bacterium CG_4_8_14_3_um_filter_49_14]
MILKDTMVAIATPMGVGGIGIIRVSGPLSEEIARLLFKSRKQVDNLMTHHLYHGDIISPETGAILDEVMITLMRKPHSYTGEDTLEISCHGGPLILQAVLSEVIKAGARPAEPGEFTRRAFLNNRLDLSQAEAVADLIMAKTERGLEAAVSHLKGELAKKIEFLRTSIIDVLAILETSIDFSEEDADIERNSEIAGTIQAVVDELHAILMTYERGKIYRHGLGAVITGKPNVGKSSLFNRLLGEKRAIVTPIPGTTRDFIEEFIVIRGIPVRLADTAGIRYPENIIEQEGIALVREKLSLADVVIIVLDGSDTLTEEDIEIIEKNRTRKTALVINKMDLPRVINIEKVRQLAPDLHPLWISAKCGDGIPALKEVIYTLAMKQEDNRQATVMITNIRHKTAIEKAVVLLSQARNSITGGLSPELPALDVREALDSLGEIVGKTVNEDILDRIFSTFCIGK